MKNFAYDDETIDWKVPIETSLLIDKNIPDNALRLYLVLLSYARNKTTAFPSRETLAGNIGKSTRTVDTLKNKLKDLGLLSWESKFNGSNIYNFYTLLKYEPIIKGITKPKKIKKSLLVSKKENTIPKENNIPEKKEEQKEAFVYKPEKIVKSNFSKYEPIIKIFKENYKKVCDEHRDELERFTTSGWIDNPIYIPTAGDFRNLKWYESTYGEKGLKKIEIGFKFLTEFLVEEVGYGLFYNGNGAELVPTISLFLKAKIEHDKLLRFATDELDIIRRKQILEERKKVG